MRRTVLIIILLFCGTSCSKYVITNRCHHIVQKNYSKPDKIVVKDAIICADAGAVFNKTTEVNRDSVFDLLLNSLQKLPINIERKNGNRYCNSQFVKNSKLKFRRFNFQELNSLIGNEEGDFLIPVINIQFVTFRNMYVTSTGAIGNGGFTKGINLQLAILIFRNDKLIYFKSRVFISDSVTDDNSHQSTNPIQRENWDKLVYLVMEDYIKRIK